MVVEDPCHQLPDIFNALSTTEEHLLSLVKEMEQGLVSLEDFTSILSGKLAELKRWYRHVVEKGEVRTINFRTVRMLRELDETTVYLYRKIRLEEMFFTKLALEKKLRSLVSTEAFDLYQQLQDVAESENALSATSDAQVRHLLLGKGPGSHPLPPSEEPSRRLAKCRSRDWDPRMVSPWGGAEPNQGTASEAPVE